MTHKIPRVGTQRLTGEVPSFAVNNSVGMVVYIKPEAIDDSNIDDFIEFTGRQVRTLYENDELCNKHDEFGIFN